MEVFLWLALVLFLLLYPRVIHNSQHKPKVVDSRGLAKRLTDTVISAGDAIFVYALIVTTSLVNLVATLYKGRSKSLGESQYSLRNIERLLNSAVSGSSTSSSKDSQLEVLWALDNARNKPGCSTCDFPSTDSLSDFWDPAIPDSTRERWISWLVGYLKGRKPALKEKPLEIRGEYQPLLKPTHETKLPRAVSTFTNYTLTVEMGDSRTKTVPHGDAKSPAIQSSIGKPSHPPAKKDIEVNGNAPKQSSAPSTLATQRSGDSAAEPILRKTLYVPKERASVAAPAATQQTTIATQTSLEKCTSVSRPNPPNTTIATQTRPFSIIRPARTSLATQTSVTALSHIATQTKSEHYMTTATQTRQFRPTKPPRAHVGTQTRPEPHYNRGIQTLPYRPAKPPHRTTAVQTTISQTSIAVQTCASFPSLTNASSLTAMNTESLTNAESDEETSTSEGQTQYTSTGCQTFSEGENFPLSMALPTPRPAPDTATTGTQTLIETETPNVPKHSPLHLEEPKDVKPESEPMSILRAIEKARAYRKKFTQSLSVPQDDKTPNVDTQPPAETPKSLVEQTSNKQPKTVHYASNITTEIDLQRGFPDTKTTAANNASKEDNRDMGVQAIVDSKSEYRVMERIRMLECRLRLADVRCQRWSERMSKAEEVVETLQNQLCILNTTLRDLKSKETHSVKCVKTVEQQVQVSLKDLKSVDMRSVDRTRYMDVSHVDVSPMEDISEVITKTTYAQEIQVQPRDRTDVKRISLAHILPKPTIGPVSLPLPGPLPGLSFFNTPPAFSRELGSLIKELRREMETQMEETTMKYRISNISVQSYETAESSRVSKYVPCKEEVTPRSLLRSDQLSAEEQIIKITMNEISDSSARHIKPMENYEPCKSLAKEHTKKVVGKRSSESTKRYKKHVQKLDLDKLLSPERKSNDSECSTTSSSKRHRRVSEKNESHKTFPKERKSHLGENPSLKRETVHYRSIIEKNESAARKSMPAGTSNASYPSSSTAPGASAAVAAAAVAMAAESEFSRLPTPGGTGDAAPFHSIQVSPVSSEDNTSISSNSDESGGQRRFLVARASSSSTTRRLQTGPVKVLNLDSKSATNLILTCYEEDA